MLRCWVGVWLRHFSLFTLQSASLSCFEGAVGEAPSPHRHRHMVAQALGRVADATSILVGVIAEVPRTRIVALATGPIFFFLWGRPCLIFRFALGLTFRFTVPFAICVNPNGMIWSHCANKHGDAQPPRTEWQRTAPAAAIDERVVAGTV